jgi:hypothetical protein
MLVHQADHHAAMRHLGVDEVLQVSGDGVGEILRHGCKWNTGENQGEIDDSDAFSDVHILGQATFT